MDLVVRYRAGASANDLAAQFKIHRRTVSAHLHNHGVTMRGQSLAEAQVSLAINLYGQGLSVAQIGTRLSVNGGTVWLALRASGVQMRDTHGRAR